MFSPRQPRGQEIDHTGDTERAFHIYAADKNALRLEGLNRAWQSSRMTFRVHSVGPFAGLVAERVKHLVTFGETAEMIAEKVTAVKSPQPAPTLSSPAPVCSARMTGRPPSAG